MFNICNPLFANNHLQDMFNELTLFQLLIPSYIYNSVQFCFANYFNDGNPKHSFSNLQSPLLSVLFFCSCDKLDHKQEIRFLLYLLGQIVDGQS